MTASRIQRPSPRMALALIPGAVLLAMRFVITADEDLWSFFRVSDAAVLIAAVVVTAINFRIDRHMTLWSLPALGVGIPALLICLNTVLWALLPQPLLYPPPALHTIGTKAINDVYPRALLVKANTLAPETQQDKNALCMDGMRTVYPPHTLFRMPVTPLDKSCRRPGHTS